MYVNQYNIQLKFALSAALAMSVYKVYFHYLNAFNATARFHHTLFHICNSLCDPIPHLHPTPTLSLKSINLGHL